ncbi:MAG: ftsQ [Ilumatobacteraceae bacterium]|nr:ftsQ [Ilumatobacteraceae bacterium]
MTEPTPPEADDVPDSVLDELRLVFADPEQRRTEPVAAPTATANVSTPTTILEDPDLELDDDDDDDDPDLELDDPDTGSVVAVAPAAPQIIVIGGDDSLPDAVYLDDGELGPLSRAGEMQPDGRNTIIIGDELDSTGAFDAVEVPSRSMDPRVRARRVAVKRARGRKRLLWVGVVVLVVLIAVAVLAVFSSSLFAVDQVDVQGATYTQHYESAQLQAIIDDLKGEPVLLVDTLAAERKLEAIPWIERAFVKTDFPNRVFIDIRERRPLATFVGSDGKYRVIDRDGRVVAVLDGRPTDYMLLTGPAPDTDAGELAGAPFAAAAQMVSALPAEIRSLAVSASVDATTGDLGLMILPPPNSTETSTSAPSDSSAADPSDAIEVRVGSPSNLDGKLARLLQLIRDGLDGVVRIDVSANEPAVTKG